jgi:hypothetical protein
MRRLRLRLEYIQELGISKQKADIREEWASVVVKETKMTKVPSLSIQMEMGFIQK